MESVEPPRFILFVPPAPSTNPSLSELKAAFGDTVSQVLKEAASHSSTSPKASVLEIALACPHLVGHEKKTRSSLYQPTQTLLAAIYKLICVIAAQDNVNIEDNDGVDVRIILVAWSLDSPEDVGGRSSYGPIVDIAALASSARQWQFAFGVENDAGEAMVKAFVLAKGRGGSVSHTQKGPDRTTEDPLARSANSAQKASNQSSTRHPHAVVGGTFDHIHIGHKLLLTMTVFAADPPENSTDSSPKEHSATIGITGSQLLVNKKHAAVLESWSDRCNIVHEFVASITNFSPTQTPAVSTRNDAGPNGKSVDWTYGNGLVVKGTEIQDPFGPTITEERLSALIISAETREGGKAVNDKRAEKGWKTMEVFEVDVLDASGADSSQGAGGFESKISSTAIREKIAKKSGKL